MPSVKIRSREASLASTRRPHPDRPLRLCHVADLGGDEGSGVPGPILYFTRSTQPA
jgi:hypothetical protein